MPTDKNNPPLRENARQRFDRLSVAVCGAGAFTSRFCAIAHAANASFSKASLFRSVGDRVRLSNEAEGEERVDWISNEFEVLQGDWVQVAPYGQFPHPRGMQYFDRSDAERLVDKFGSIVAKLLRRFGGLPWYEGHPDTNPKDFPNKRSYGWIDQLQAREDGLYAHVKWTRAGRELIEEGAYKFFSPVWDAKPDRVAGKAVLRPIELISVGFTNMPNMPVLPLSNEEAPAEESAETADATTAAPNEESAPVVEQEHEQEQEETDMKLPNNILTALGFAEDSNPTVEQIVEAWAARVEAPLENSRKFASALVALAGLTVDKAVDVVLAPEIITQAVDKVTQTVTAATELANEQAAQTELLENARRAAQTAEDAATEARRQLDEERNERIELLVANGIAGGKITKAEADDWRDKLRTDFDTNSTALANAKPAIKTTSVTDELGVQQAALETGAKPADQAKALANEKVRTKHISFDAAWREVKRERSDLFNGMQQPRGRG